jgi:hypothetical protein
MCYVAVLQVYKALKNDVIPVAAKLLAADGDQDAFAREVRTCQRPRHRHILCPAVIASADCWGFSASISHSCAPE